MARNLTMWRILYVIIMCRIHKRSAPSGLRNPPHTRSLSGGYSKPQWGMKKPRFDVHSFRKRKKKWTLWTLKRHFSGWYPFTSKTEARKRPFSAPYPFNRSWVSILFRPIPVHRTDWLMPSTSPFFRSIPVQSWHGVRCIRSFSGPCPFTLWWYTLIFVLGNQQTPVHVWQEQ